MSKIASKGLPTTGSKCIIYCRVSSFAQASGTSVSLEAQESLSIKLAKSRGYRVKKVCKEVGSAYKSSMKSFKELLVSNKNTTILLYDVSRFCRGVKNGMEMLDMALSKNNSLVFVYDNFEINSENKEAQLSKFTTLLEQSEKESLKIGSRIKTAQQYLRDQGKYCGGYLPYGYKVIKSIDAAKNNILVENPVEQNKIAFINLCRNPVISSKKLNYLMKKISPQIPYIKISCYDKDQKTTLDTINNSLTNGEIATLLNDYNVKKRGSRWTTSSVKNTKVEASVEINLSNMSIFDNNEDDNNEDDNNEDNEDDNNEDDNNEDNEDDNNEDNEDDNNEDDNNEDNEDDNNEDDNNEDDNNEDDNNEDDNNEDDNNEDAADAAPFQHPNYSSYQFQPQFQQPQFQFQQPQSNLFQFQQPQSNPFQFQQPQSNPFQFQQPQSNPFQFQQPQSNPFQFQQPQSNPFQFQQPQSNPFQFQQPQSNPFQFQQPQSNLFGFHQPHSNLFGFQQLQLQPQQSQQSQLQLQPQQSQLQRYGIKRGSLSSKPPQKKACRKKLTKKTLYDK
jgi:DNA invertase Pin-like site-specific DNA recombinase